MIYFSIAYLFCTIFYCIWFGNGFGFFNDIAFATIVFLTVPPTLFLTVGVAGIDGCKRAISDLCKSDSSHPRSMSTFKTLGDFGLWIGLLITILNLILLGSNIRPETVETHLATGLSICLMSLMLGVIFKLLSIIAIQKLQQHVN